LGIHRSVPALSWRDSSERWRFPKLTWRQTCPFSNPINIPVARCKTCVNFSCLRLVIVFLSALADVSSRISDTQKRFRLSSAA
jgi:hypothetical protein